MAALVMSAGGARPSGQQQAPTPPPTFRTAVDTVRLEVSVLDHDRRPVRGLTADDFIVLEDGRERPIVAFAPVELTAPAPVDGPVAPWLQDAPRDVVSNDTAEGGRLVVIAFDWSIRALDMLLARKIALAAVDALGPTDQAAVIFTSANAGAGAPLGFTGDRALLRATINKPFLPVALVPNTIGLIDNPERYETGECLCGQCTMDNLSHLAQTLRTVSQRPKVVLFIGTYVRTSEQMKLPSRRPLIPGQIPPSTTCTAPASVRRG
jgi:VWFA-related protein